MTLFPVIGADRDIENPALAPPVWPVKVQELTALVTAFRRIGWKLTLGLPAEIPELKKVSPLPLVVLVGVPVDAP